jgi:hypothetical protein
MKNQVWANVIRKLLGVTDVILVSSAKNIRNAMKNVTFSYGKILNRGEKRLANKSADYGKTIREFAAKHDLLPENDPRFAVVYNIIANADTVEGGILKIFENFPLCIHLISPAVEKFKLKKIHLDNNPKKEGDRNSTLNDWQLQLELELQTTPDLKKIIWYYDPVGNTGKTFFAKWKYQLDNSTALVLGNQTHAIYHILSKRTDDTKIVILDSNRSAYEEINYDYIENVKNGCFQSGEYCSTMTVMAIPHVVVFSNFKPNITQLSLDRYDVRKLVKIGDNITVHKVTLIRKKHVKTCKKTIQC